MLVSVQFAMKTISYTKEAALPHALLKHILTILLVLVKNYFKTIIYLYVIACSDHCAECEAAGCKACGDGYELDADNKCMLIFSPTPSTPTTEEAGSSGGGMSGGAVAGIACGSVAVVSLAGWSVYSFVAKKLAFAKKLTMASKNPYVVKQNPANLEVSNPVSPMHTEGSALIP